MDLSHVICSPTAAGAIKSYSPDLIVHPILSEEYVVLELGCPVRRLTHGYQRRRRDSLRPELEALLSRLHVLVIGPGLGREEYMQKFARLALDIAKEQGMFLVIDADGLFMVGNHLNSIRGYRRAVLTPNVVEFKRLSGEVVRTEPHVLSIEDKLVGHVRASIQIHRQRNVRHRCQGHWAA